MPSNKKVFLFLECLQGKADYTTNTGPELQRPPSGHVYNVLIETIPVLRVSVSFLPVAMSLFPVPTPILLSNNLYFFLMFIQPFLKGGQGLMVPCLFLFSQQPCEVGHAER